LLVDQSGQGVGEVAGEGSQEPGELAQGSGQRPGELGQQDLPGGDLGQRPGVGGAERAGPQQSALDHQRRCRTGELPQGLGHQDGVTVDEGDGRGPGEQLADAGKAEVGHGQADEGVLVDLVLAPRLSHRLAEPGQLVDLEAPVLGEQGGAGCRQPAAHLVDDGDLIGAGVLDGHGALLARAAARQAGGSENRLTWSGGPESRLRAAAHRTSLASEF
jgi:hypothetical protein